MTAPAPLARRYDWRSRLAAYITQATREPFDWGTHDCALHAANAVLAMTGVDLAAEFRGAYSTPEGAYKALRKLDLDDVAGLAASRLPEIPPALASAGDIAVVLVENEPALGVVIGERISVIRPGEHGGGTVALTDAVRAFRV
jgi:hypothetical protein